jgi:hypothetical protein
VKETVGWAFRKYHVSFGHDVGAPSGYAPIRGAGGDAIATHKARAASPADTCAHQYEYWYSVTTLFRPPPIPVPVLKPSPLGPDLGPVPVHYCPLN